MQCRKCPANRDQSPIRSRCSHCRNSPLKPMLWRSGSSRSGSPRSKGTSSHAASSNPRTTSIAKSCVTSATTTKQPFPSGYLMEKGFHPDSPQDASWGERYFHLPDPDGHELSFARPISPGTGAPTHSGRVSCVEYYHAKILYRLRNAGSCHKLLIRKDLCTLAKLAVLRVLRTEAHSNDPSRNSPENWPATQELQRPRKEMLKEIERFL